MKKYRRHQEIGTATYGNMMGHEVPEKGIIAGHQWGGAGRQGVLVQFFVNKKDAGETNFYNAGNIASPVVVECIFNGAEDRRQTAVGNSINSAAVVVD